MQTEQPRPTPDDCHVSRPKAVRSWVFGALFVWALTGAVAVAAFSSRETAVSPAANLALTPENAAPLAEKPDANPMNSVKGIQWETDFDSAMRRARLENKPIMVDFYTDWCGVCKMLDREVLPDKNVIAESRNWISIKINAEKRPDVAGAYGVTGYPTLVFAAKSGKPLSILPGFAAAPEFVQIMKEARGKLKPNA